MYYLFRTPLLQLSRGLYAVNVLKDTPKRFASVNIRPSYHVTKLASQITCKVIYSSRLCPRTSASSSSLLAQSSALIFTTNTKQHRSYRAGRGSRGIERDGKPEGQKTTLQLMDVPWVIWPSLWHTVRNWIFANLIIHRYLDQEFSLSSFKTGAVQALVHVSSELSKGNFEALHELITKPTLEEIQRNFARLSLKQRLDLAVVADDIFFSFPYQIGIIFTNEGMAHERIFVEITMCYHVFRGFQDHINSTASGETPSHLSGIYDNYDRISIANYRYIREFTRGVEDQWTISLANHFKPGELIQQR